ncbi:MAG: hypothetical protein CFE44_13725 [Burkholderiales bacterium PBB4]|nr:MAG: hypothetical protein CFE44_13725 [Burkholderiales bacterium PBB4]
MEALTDERRAAIARKLTHLNRNAAVGPLEAAVVLNTTVGRIYQATSAKRIAKGKMNLKLPPRIDLNGSRLAWRLGDILDLVAGSPIALPVERATKGAKPPKRMGRLTCPLSPCH